MSPDSRTNIQKAADLLNVAVGLTKQRHEERPNALLLDLNLALSNATAAIPTYMDETFVETLEGHADQLYIAGQSDVALLVNQACALLRE